MARKRASMREGPLAELFRATEAAQRQAEQTEQPAEQEAPAARAEPLEPTVEHVPSFLRDEDEPPRAAPPLPSPPASVRSASRCRGLQWDERPRLARRSAPGDS